MSDEEEEPVTASEPEEEEEEEEAAVGGGGGGEGGDAAPVEPAVSFESLMEAPTLAWEKLKPSGSSAPGPNGRSSNRVRRGPWPPHKPPPWFPKAKTKPAH